MSNYTKSVNFAAKDALASGDPLKIIRGTEIDTEYSNIATAVATKADTASPTFTGTITAAAATFSGNVTGVTQADTDDSTKFATTAFVRDILPPGVIVDYGASAIPSGWLEADGTAVSRTTYAALFAIYSTTHGAGDGSTTFNLPNLGNRVVVGAGVSTLTEDINAADVNTSTDALTVASNNTKFVTGMAVVLTTTGGAPGGLTAGNTYYVIRASSTTVKLASSLANAQNGTQIDITSQGTGVHTLTHTYTTRAFGEVGGEDAHAMSSAEQLLHTHVQDAHDHIERVHTGASTSITSLQQVSVNSNAGIVNVSSGITTASTVATNQNTGGNSAMNIMQPFIVLRKIIKT